MVRATIVHWMNMLRPARAFSLTCPQRGRLKRCEVVNSGHARYSSEPEWYSSRIHRSDLIGLIQWAIAMQAISGPLNAVAPEAVTMKTFCATIGKVLHRPSWIPVPGLALRLALGELGTMMTTGQRVHPEKALTGGYVFRYPTLEAALRAIVTKR